MPLIFATPPKDSFKALEQGLHTIAHGHRPLAAKPKQLVMRPHPVYNLGLDALVAGYGIEAAKLVRWRYLLVEGDAVSKAAEIGISPDGTSDFQSLTAGRAVNGTAKALAVAEQMPQVTQRPYEIRFLRIVALSIQALWLHDKESTDDQFLLMQAIKEVDDTGAVTHLDALKPYSAAQLFPVLYALVKRKERLKRDVKPG